MGSDGNTLRLMTKLVDEGATGSGRYFNAFMGATIDTGTRPGPFLWTPRKYLSAHVTIPWSKLMMMANEVDPPGLFLRAPTNLALSESPGLFPLKNSSSTAALSKVLTLGKSSRAPITSPRSRLMTTTDGGGVRGLSSLILLQQLQKELNDARAEKENWRESSTGVLPQDIDTIMDMIVGTSTGGYVDLEVPSK
jgi:hypothetical protein